MLDEILEFFDRRKTRPHTDRQRPLSDLIGSVVDEDHDDGDAGRRFRHDEDRHRDPRRGRFDRRQHVEDWD
jgi:hypothetical protein